MGKSFNSSISTTTICSFIAFCLGTCTTCWNQKYSIASCPKPALDTTKYPALLHQLHSMSFAKLGMGLLVFWTSQLSNHSSAYTVEFTQKLSYVMAQWLDIKRICSLHSPHSVYESLSTPSPFVGASTKIGCMCILQKQGQSGWNSQVSWLEIYTPQFHQLMAGLKIGWAHGLAELLRRKFRPQRGPYMSPKPYWEYLSELDRNSPVCGILQVSKIGMNNLTNHNAPFFVCREWLWVPCRM